MSKLIIFKKKNTLNSVNGRSDNNNRSKNWGGNYIIQIKCCFSKWSIGSKIKHFHNEKNWTNTSKELRHISKIGH